MNRNLICHKFRHYYVFFKSTLLLSIVTGLGLSVSSEHILASCMQLIPTAGLGINLLYKEIVHKEEYFFFYNQGIGRIELWIATFFMSATSCFILYNIISQCVHVWKSIVS